MIEVLLALSILANGFLIWYVIRLLKKFLNVSEELEDLFVVLEEYSEHADVVYNLERFYGDTTLENLMRHTKATSEQAKIYYFTKVHEQAIIDFCSCADMAKRNELYNEYIGPAFNEMVDKIVYTYKFTNLPNIDYLKEDCKNWLITVLDKYDPTRGSKAFSYFSVITKNWFIHKVKKHTQKFKREVPIEDYCSPVNYSKNINHPLATYNTFVDDQIKNEFWLLLKKNIKAWEELPVRNNEKKVIQAVKILLKKPKT